MNCFPFNKMSNKLIDNYNNNLDEDSDEDNDEDYRPENDSLSEANTSGSDEQNDEFEDNQQKGKSFRKKGIKRRENVEHNEEETKIDNKLNEEQEKEKADSLWAEFCKDMPIVSNYNKIETINNTNNSLKSDSSCAQNNDKSIDNSNKDVNEKVLISKTYDFAGESVSVIQESEDNSFDNNNKVKEGVVKGIKRSGGLGGILDKLKKPKISTLQKSLIDWNNFKKDEGIVDELNQHNKSKDTFIERQAFLQRTDLRQFEIEKEVRAKNRAQRDLSKH